MSPIIIGIIGSVLLLVLLAIGVPIALVLMVVGGGGLVFFLGLGTAAGYITNVAFHYMVYDFITIPLFVFLGLLAAQGEIVRDLTIMVDKWLGKVRGTLGVSTIAGCTFFGVLTGSATVTAAVFSRTMAPEMRQQGYDKNFAYGICASGGVIGMLIPPSTLAVVYGLLSSESIGQLLVAGICPGILIAIIFSIGILIMARKYQPHKKDIKWTWTERFKSLGTLWQVILVGGVILGGIYSGVFTVVEAAAVGCMAMLVITLGTRKVNLGQLKTSMLETMSITAMVFFLIIGARVFSRFLTLSTIAPELLSLIGGWSVTPVAIIGILAIVYIILGCFLDSISMLSITIPVIYPIVTALGVDPMWFAMVVIVAIHVGLITPPMGLNLFVAQAVAEPDVSFEDIMRGCIPFFVMLLIALLIVFLAPAISTWLPAQITY